jgi:hypothetical protein
MLTPDGLYLRLSKEAQYGKDVCLPLYRNVSDGYYVISSGEGIII